MAPDIRDLETYHFYDDWDSYEALRDWFEWEVPEKFNVADYVCDRWAERNGNAAAMYVEEADSGESVYTFRQLRNRANRLANYLSSQGIGRGDCVAVSGSQRFDLMAAHLATFKLGAVSVPFSNLLGPDGLAYRLRDCEAKTVVATQTNIDVVREAAPEASSVDTVLALGEVTPAGEEVPLPEALAGQSTEFENADTDAEETATIIYTSGTTGQPKGVVHAHRHVLGILPGFLTVVGMEVSDTAANRTVVEWSWIASLSGMVLGGWFYGQPVVGYTDDEFDPVTELETIQKYELTSFHAPATGMRMMMQLDDIDQYDLSSVTTVASGGEALGPDVVEWIEDTFQNADVVEGYGQTEAAALVGDYPTLGYQHRNPHMGVPAIGTEVAILDPETRERIEEPGEVGELAARYEDNPMMFKEYLGRPEKTAEKVQDGWLLSEDLVSRDEEGYIRFHSRNDDVIISSGYRLGPTEIEEAVESHDAVMNAGVIGIPDETRGEVPKAFVELPSDADPSEELAEELQTHVKERLARYEYPRELEFVDQLPRTTTGKVRRIDLRKREGID